MLKLISALLKIKNLSLRHTFGHEFPILFTILAIDSWSGVGHVIRIVIFEKLSCCLFDEHSLVNLRVGGLDYRIKMDELKSFRALTYGEYSRPGFF